VRLYAHPPLGAIVVNEKVFALPRPPTVCRHLTTAVSLQSWAVEGIRRRPPTLRLAPGLGPKTFESVRPRELVQLPCVSTVSVE